MAYTLFRFWNYVFVPLVLAALAAFLTVVFTATGNQTEIGNLMKPFIENGANAVKNTAKATIAQLPNTK